MSSAEEEKQKEDNNINNQNNPNDQSNPDSSLLSPEDSQKTQESSLKEQQQENQAELSEIETGSTNLPDFDEIINFNHNFINYRITKIFPDRETFENSCFDLLTTNIFIYSGDVIDFKSITTNLSNSEAIKTIRQRINTYKDQDTPNKKAFIENIPFYVKTLGFKETVEYIVPIISDLTREKEIISSKFFEIFPKFVDEIIKFGDKSYFILKDYLVKLISEFLVDNNNNIYKKNPAMVKQIMDGLVYLSKYIKSEDKGESVLAIVIKMAQDDDDELKRVASMSLFGALIPYVDKDFFRLFIIPQVKSFADDPSGNVRKEVANQLYNISQNVSKDIFKKRILPVYQKLSKDTLWFVKKVAVEILPKITKLCDNNIILKNIMPIFKNFANEEKVEVKLSVVETLGEFISLLDKKESNNFTDLLDFYIKTVQKFSEKNKREYKLILAKCAFNFPAMLDFFGKDSWSKLKPSFIIMANDKEKDERIKLPLASAIGDIANIIGPELTEEDLLEYVDKFFKQSSNNSDLKLKILENLPKIIRQIQSNNKKNSYLEFIKYMIVNKETKWRKRMQYAKIVGKFNECFAENMIYKRVFPIAINFCFDDISQVRFCSAKKNSKLILQLISGKEEYRDKTIIIIKSFAQSINYKYRQLFVLMCKHLLGNEIFEKNIAELLIDLAYDQVPNVKIVLAKFVYNLLRKEKYKNLEKNETIRKIVKILKKDKNKEVLSYMDKINNLELDDVIAENEKNVNLKFKDNMNFVSKEFGITRNVPLDSVFKESKFKGDDTNNGDKKEEEQKNKETQIEENKIGETQIEEDKKEENKNEEVKKEEKQNEVDKIEEVQKEENKETINKEESEKKEEEQKEENKENINKEESETKEENQKDENKENINKEGTEAK